MKGGSSAFQTMFANVSKVLTAHPLQTHETFNNYRSEPATVPSLNVSKALALKGGSERKLKNISEYTNNGSYRVFNKQMGGNDIPAAVNIGLNESDSITNQSKTVGWAPNRVADASTLNIIANQEINGPSVLNKTVHFGNVTGLTESKTNFGYGGAGKKATKKHASPRRVTKSAKK